MAQYIDVRTAAIRLANYASDGQADKVETVTELLTTILRMCDEYHQLKQEDQLPTTVKRKSIARSKSKSYGFTKIASKSPAKPLELAAKKPLNAWMGYRAFYKDLFRQYQQKDASGWLSQLWSEDPSKIKWTIIAAAYSILRDRYGKQNAPLDLFLMYAAPVMGIIPVQQYLATMGWEFTIDNNLSRLNDPGTLPAHLSVSPLTTQELVTYALQAGYIPQPLPPATNAPVVTNGPIMAVQPTSHPMAASAATPGSNVMSSTDDQETPTEADTPAESSTDGSTQGLTPATASTPSTTTSPAAKWSSTDTEQNDNNAMDEFFDMQAYLEDYVIAPHPAMEATLNASAATNRALLQESGSCYPHNDQFDPANADYNAGLFFDLDAGADFLAEDPFKF